MCCFPPTSRLTLSERLNEGSNESGPDDDRVKHVPHSREEMLGSESEQLQQDLHGEEEEENILGFELSVVVSHETDDEGVDHDQNVEEDAEYAMLW